MIFFPRLTFIFNSIIKIIIFYMVGWVPNPRASMWSNALHFRVNITSSEKTLEKYLKLILLMIFYNKGVVCERLNI